MPVSRFFSIIGAAFVAFLIGMTVMYFLVPTVFPGRAEELTRLAEAVAEDSSTLADFTLLDSLSMARAALDSLLADEADSLDAGGESSLPLVVALLRDSLHAAHAERDSVASLLDGAKRTVDQLKGQLADAIVPDAGSAELARTLASMDDRQLQPILKSLSNGALEALYHQASARDRRRLIAAMPPERATRLVQRQLAAHELPVPPVADSLIGAQ